MKMISAPENLPDLLGEGLYQVFTALCARIEQDYDMERILNHTPGKKWDYECRYRRGGKTLCGLYARKDCLGFMVIFGKNEREKFEAARQDFSAATQREYDSAAVYHDGKWIMLFLSDTSLFPDIDRLLRIKRRPNRK